MEYFDVVDKQDRPTGQKVIKEVAHEKGILHRIAAVFVFDRKGRLYVQEHKKLGLLDHSVGGHVTTGEDYLTAAAREAKEELGLGNFLLTEISLSYRSIEMYPRSTIQHMFGIYECHPGESWQFAPNDEVNSIYTESIENIVKHMHNDPGAFTSGFISTMFEYIRVKGLPIRLDIELCRKKME